MIILKICFPKHSRKQFLWKHNFNQEIKFLFDKQWLIRYSSFFTARLIRVFTLFNRSNSGVSKVRILISRALEYLTLHAIRNFADVIKFIILRLRNYLVIQVGLNITTVVLVRRSKKVTVSEWDVKMERGWNDRGSWAKKCA